MESFRNEGAGMDLASAEEWRHAAFIHRNWTYFQQRHAQY
jgi:hypothetical protein